MLSGRTAVALVLAATALDADATRPDSQDRSIQQFLAKDDSQPSYRATRRLEAENGGRSGWVEATTEYSRATGFRYSIQAEGGSGYIRSRILRAVLEGERDAIAKGETSRSSLDRSNYTFQTQGVGADGLAQIRLTPRRRDRVLVDGTMYLELEEGNLVRLEGRLAKSPSFWIKDVDIVRSYRRYGNAVLPIALESTAQVRFLGPARLRMTFEYLEIDGKPVAPRLL